MGREVLHDGARRINALGRIARRLAGDASLISMVENEKGEPLNVGRRTRTIPPATTWDELLVNQQIQITPSTTITGGTGEALDVDHAGDGLMRRVQRMKHVSAETPVGYD